MNKKWWYLLAAVVTVLAVMSVMHLAANGMLPAIPNPHGG